jgi:hypothetical protein
MLSPDGPFSSTRSNAASTIVWVLNGGRIRRLSHML